MTEFPLLLRQLNLILGFRSIKLYEVTTFQVQLNISHVQDKFNYQQLWGIQLTSANTFSCFISTLVTSSISVAKYSSFSNPKVPLYEFNGKRSKLVSLE